MSAHPDQFVEKYTDIGAVNLACARGLAHCDEAEFPKYLALLDTIAEAVRVYTEKNRRLFKIKPKQFHNSENVFRLLTMEHVFRVQFGIKYDPKVREITQGGKPWLSDDSSEIFIQGLLSKKRTGTCSSLPTFAIAVGRRLGYPLWLILVPNHTLYRWDDGQEVFNLQPTEVGGEVKEDDCFRNWPRKWDEYDHAVQARTKVWLHPLTPKKVVSKFLCNRALMLRDTGRYEEAFQAIDAAVRYDPINPACPEISNSIEYAMAGGDLASWLSGNGPRYSGWRGGEVLSPPVESKLGGVPPWPAEARRSTVNSFDLPPEPPKRQVQPLDAKLREERDFADEHWRLVNQINEANRKRSPQHPDGNPPTEPLMRKLTQLLENRKVN